MPPIFAHKIQAYPPPPPYFELYTDAAKQDATHVDHALFTPPEPVKNPFLKHGVWQEPTSFRQQPLINVPILFERKVSKQGETPRPFERDEITSFRSDINYNVELRKLLFGLAQEYVGIFKTLAGGEDEEYNAWLRRRLENLEQQQEQQKVQTQDEQERFQQEEKQPEQAQQQSTPQQPQPTIEADSQGQTSVNQSESTTQPMPKFPTDPAIVPGLQTIETHLRSSEHRVVNILHLIGMLRSHQARQGLAAMMESQITKMQTKRAQLDQKVMETVAFVAEAKGIPVDELIRQLPSRRQAEHETESNAYPDLTLQASPPAVDHNESGEAEPSLGQKRKGPLSRI